MERTGVAERTKLREAPLGSYRAAPAPASVHTFRGDDSHRARESRGDRQLSSPRRRARWKNKPD